MRIAIACGDPNGIGPEVTLKALTAERNSDSIRYTLFGHPDQLLALNTTLGTSLPLVSSDRASDSDRWILEPSAFRLPGQGADFTSDAAAGAALGWLRAGAECCLRGGAAALVTAPVSKETIIRAGHPAFVGQTEFLSELASEPRTIMMLLGADDRGHMLRVALATNHLAIRRVADSLTVDRIELAIQRASQACRDLKLPRAKVAVCGLNPHAGEGGQFGTEEAEIILPAVKRAQERGFDVVGPLPADTLFHYAYQGDFDAVVAMYHDQGLVPLKMIGFESGVNWTLGLPFIRTSPDHGTAFDIAGRGIATPSSMVAALRLAKQLARS